MDSELLKELCIPLGSLTIGAVLYKFCEPPVKTAGIFMVFFGAQTGMNLYMKAVLSNSVVDAELGLRGLPASFLVTAFQQMVGFFLFWIGLAISRLTPYKYYPKVLNSQFEFMAVCLFAISFTMNIALNNFSLSLISIAINLIIRSCLPLSTFLSQRVSAVITKQPVKPINLVEVGLMLLGVVCAAVAVVAKMQGSGKKGGESKNMLFGVIVCVISLFSGSINLALAGVLGTSVKLNSLDTTVYNAIPATLLLLLPMFLYKHPLNWKGYEGQQLTDIEIFNIVRAKNTTTIFLAALSGALSLAYNTLQYGIVQCLTATHVAFAGNFNKALTIPLALLVGLEHLPKGIWGWIMLLACFGSIGAFAAYNVVSGGAGGHGGKSEPVKKEAEVEEEDEDEDTSSEDESDSSEAGCFGCSQ